MLGRGARVPLLLAAVLLVAPMVGAAPFLQWGADGARTGNTRDPGPEAFDVALRLALPGLREWDAPPLVLNGRVLVLVNVSYSPDRSAAGAGIWSVDLATGALERLVDLEPSGTMLSSLSSDGERLFVGEADGLHAYFAADGTPAWQRPAVYPQGVRTAPATTDCLGGAVTRGVVYLVCTQYSRAPSEQVALAWGIDAATGTTLWSWFRGAGAEYEALLPLSGTPVSPGAIIGQTASVVDGVVILSTLSPDPGRPDPCRGTPMPAEPGTTSAMTYLVWGLDAATGEQRWVRPAPAFQPNADGPPLRPVFASTDALLDPPAITGAPGAAHIGYQNQVVRIDPATGCEQDRVALTDPDGPSEALDPPGVPSEALALAANTLYATAYDRLYAIDAESYRILWDALLPGPPPQLQSGGLVLAGSMAFGTSYDDGFYALAASDGSVLWQSDFSADRRTGPPFLDDVPEPPAAFAVGERVIAVVDGPGTLTVIGKTGASIRIAADVSDRFPSIGREVRIDLGGSRPGVQSPDTEFQVVWGDGASDDWQDARAFAHTYAEAGQFAAIVSARNEAGQTSSETIVFDVGGTPPSVPRYIDEPFARENADITFGFLGVGLTAIGAVVAVARHRRHQHALAPLGVSERTELYRAALARAVIDDGTVPAPQAAVLAELRARLGLTDRDHALLLQSVLAARRSGSGLDLRPGETVLGKYRIQRLLGSGGQGRTYVAEDTALGRPVALKILHPGTGDEQAILREARAIGSIRHPNVVTVHDVDRFGDGVFVVMEFVEGGSLKERLARGPMVTAEFRGLARDLLGALEAVHGAGTMHLDVKPGNILLTPTGQAKLADFGIAYRPGLESTAQAWRTNSGTASGTIQYMSPEQAKGRTVTTRSDLYSAAAVLYEAWTGRPYLEPVSGESAVELQMRAAAARQFDRDIDAPEELLAWFGRALEPVAADRFNGAGEMLAGLDAALAEAERKVVRP